MLLLDWLTAILRGPKPPTQSPSQPQIDYATKRKITPLVSTAAAAQSVAYPLRKPSVDPLPALISRCIGPLDHGQRPAKAGLKTWDSVQAELRQAFADHFARIEPYLTGELAHTHPDQVAQISAQSQQAAFLLSAGAWAVGHEDRLKVQTDAERLRAIAEASLGSMPVDSRKAIEPAISFAFWFFGSLLDGYYASSYGAAQRDERDVQLRAMYHTFVQAALASYRAGLASAGRRDARPTRRASAMSESPHDPTGIDYSKKDFICPACGSTTSLGRMFVSRDPEWDRNHPSPWAGVLQTVTCAECQRTIPAHLAYRWRLTLEEAQAEWNARYREDATAPDRPE